jgi:hypothetical protein
MQTNTLIAGVGKSIEKNNEGRWDRRQPTTGGLNRTRSVRMMYGDETEERSDYLNRLHNSSPENTYLRSN